MFGIPMLFNFRTCKDIWALLENPPIANGKSFTFGFITPEGNKYILDAGKRNFLRYGASLAAEINKLVALIEDVCKYHNITALN